MKHCTRRWSAACLAAWLGFAASVAGADPVVEVGAVAITVTDLDRSLAFYTGVLDFEKLWEAEIAGSDYEHLYGVFGMRARVARLQLGQEQIELFEYLAPRGLPLPVDFRSNDLWFQHVAIIVSDMDRAYRHLRQHRVRHASPGPQRLPDWNPNAGGIEAFYFRDPDDNHLEVLRFPPGKGDARWQRTDALFLGIDHTAIVVADTDASLRFYRDLLGLQVAGTSNNYGIEQERLNNVFGARLRITALRAAAGPAIELLEYLTPRTGRPLPADAAANDLSHWHTSLVVAGVGSLETRLVKENAPLISSRIELGGNELGFAEGFLVRDPDGHPMQIVGGSATRAGR